jgi:hypothetical protein
LMRGLIKNLADEIGSDKTGTTCNKNFH